MIDKIDSIVSRLQPVLNEIKLHISTVILKNPDKLANHNIDWRSIVDYGIKSRIKSVQSIFDHIQQKSLSFKTDNDILKYFTDIVGLRVIVKYKEDIEIIKKLIVDNFKIKTDDFQIIEVKDYDLFPKKSGYRSKHIIIKVLNTSKFKPLQHTNCNEIYAEIQIRSKLQDFWAEFSHDNLYKGNLHAKQSLLFCTRQLNTLSILMDATEELFLELRELLLCQASDSYPSTTDNDNRRENTKKASTIKIEKSKYYNELISIPNINTIPPDSFVEIINILDSNHILPKEINIYLNNKEITKQIDSIVFSILRRRATIEDYIKYGAVIFKFGKGPLIEKLIIQAISKQHQ